MKRLWILGDCIVEADKKELDQLTQMSRITRNSNRPRASDRTMVDLESPFACRSRKLDGSANSPEETYQNGHKSTSPGKPNYRGLDLEKTSRLRSRQNFFLDIPFYRTHWLIVGTMACRSASSSPTLRERGSAGLSKSILATAEFQKSALFLLMEQRHSGIS